MRLAYILLLPAMVLVFGSRSAVAAPKVPSNVAKPALPDRGKLEQKLAKPIAPPAIAPQPQWARTIRTWGHGCFSKAGGFDCYGQVDNWVTESAARLRAQSLADKAVREVMQMQPGTVISSKINVRKSERGGWEAEVTVEIAVANQLALR